MKVSGSPPHPKGAGANPIQAQRFDPVRKIGRDENPENNGRSQAQLAEPGWKYRWLGIAKQGEIEDWRHAGDQDQHQGYGNRRTREARPAADQAPGGP